MSGHSRFVFGLAWLLLVTPTAAERRSFDARTDVVLVEVPVMVSTAAGEPLRGLAADDFTILDDGRRQKLAGFQIVDLESFAPAPSARQLAQLPSAARRHFLLLFDLAFSSPAAIERAQHAARRFVLEALAPSDLAAAVSFTLEHDPRLLAGFGTDRAQLARAIDTLGTTNGNGPGSETSTGADALDARTSGDAERRRAGAWAHGLGEMAERLGVLPGPKQVLYFSEGFDARLLFGRDASTDDFEVRRQQRDLERGEFWRSDAEERLGSNPLRADVDRMLEAFRRSGCTLYAVDLAGLRDERSSNGVLHHLATATGGELIDGTNDLAQALARHLAGSKLTYLLAFYPDRPGRPGERRRLEVEVRAPRGTRVAHRTSYTVPRGLAELHPFEQELLAADVVSGPRRELDLAVLAVPFSTGAERAYVAVILELAGRELLAGATGDRLPVELFAWASDAEGTMRAFFTETLELDLSRARPTEGLSYYAHLDLEPGDYLLRVLAREGNRGRIGVASRALHVPTATEPWLSPPLVASPRNALRLREKTEPSARGTVIYPFLDRGKPFAPSARPVLEANKTVTVFLFAQNLPPQDLEIEASFEREATQRTLEATLLERREGEPETLVLALDSKDLGEGFLKVRIDGIEAAIEVVSSAVH